MDIKIIFAVLAAFAGVICFLPYIVDIFRGNTKPNSYSWLIWSSLQVIGVIVMVRAGAGFGAFALGLGAMFCFLIFLLSFKYGVHKINAFDVVCLVGSLVAIAVYLSLRDPILSVAVVAFTDFLGFLPTFRKAYMKPKTETLATYVLSALSNLLAIGALSQINLTTSLYLFSLVATNATCALIIIIRKR